MSRRLALLVLLLALLAFPVALAVFGPFHEDAAYLAGRVTSRAPARQPAARPASQQPGRPVWPNPPAREHLPAA